MTTETEQPNSEPAAEPVVEQTPEQKDLDKAIRKREEAKTRTREVEAQNTELLDRLATLEGAENKRSADKDLATEEKQRKDGQWEKLVAKKDEKLSALEKRIHESETRLAQQLGKERRVGLVEAVHAQCSHVNRSTLEGLMHVVCAREGIDLSPEKLSEDLIELILDAVKAVDPNLFVAPEQTPPPRGGPGVHHPPTDSDLVARALDRVHGKQHNGGRRF